MRRSAFLVLPLIFAATPAWATGGFECHATDASGISVTGTVGHTIVSPLVTAHLQDGAHRLSTVGESPGIVIGRSWIDALEIRVDLVDPQGTRFEAQLRIRIAASHSATGTLVRGGRSHPVRCTVE